jgi:AcrR family transcriptional regulator
MVTRAQRADAVENRDRIVAAARSALTESNGAADNLKLHLVAKAAGVGQGTLYRHFPTREHLLAEVYRQEMSELVESAFALLAKLTPLEALRQWLDRILEYARVKRGVIAAIEAAAWQDLYADNHDRFDQALDHLLDRAKESGDVHSDVDATDVILLLGALSRMPPSEWETRAQKAVAIILQGVRAR